MQLRFHYIYYKIVTRIEILLHKIKYMSRVRHLKGNQFSHLGPCSFLFSQLARVTVLRTFPSLCDSPARYLAERQIRPIKKELLLTFVCTHTCHRSSFLLSYLAKQLDLHHSTHTALWHWWEIFFDICNS